MKVFGLPVGIPTMGIFVLLILLPAVCWADYVLPDTPANRARGVAGCIQRSTGEIDCSGGGGVPAPGGGPIPGPTQRDTTEEKKRKAIEKEHQRFERKMKAWRKEIEGDRAKYLDEQERSLEEQSDRLDHSQKAAHMLHIYNEKGIDSYQQGDWIGATRHFQKSLSYAPENPEIIYNLGKVQSKVREAAINYLSSVNAAWEIVSISPSLLIFHPDPYLRWEAQKQLAHSCMEEIVDAAAMFIMKERLNPRIIEPFPQETEAEKAAKKKEALRHSREVEMLRRKALSEAGETAKELDPEIIRAMKAVEIKSKPAMKQLIGICINGFQ